MAAPEQASQSWLARLWPKRLTLGFGVAVCTAVLVTEIIFLIPTSHFWYKSNQVAAIEQVRLAWYHASDPAGFLTADHKARIGQRMAADGLVLGGVVYDSAGEPLAVFGERPILDINIARLSGQSVQQSPHAPALDVHFTPEQTGLSHHMVMRLPTEPIEQATALQLRNFGLSVLFIAGLTAILFILASMFLVIKPLRAINTSLRRAVENPDHADSYQIQMVRGDEIGQISQSLNMLLTSVSVVYQDELASMKRAIDGFDFAIMQFDHSDRLVAGNPKALEMFNQPDFNGLRTMNRNCAQPLGSRGARPRPLVDVLGDTSEPMLLTLHTDTGFFTGMAYGVSITRIDGSTLYRYVAIMEMDTLMKDSRKALTSAQKADTAMKTANVQTQEMRRLLESCLCLLEQSDAGSDDFDPSFLPDRILNGWYSEAVRDGLVTGELEHGMLPLLSGDKNAIRNVLRQAMLLAYAHTQAERPVLKVDAITAGEMIEFTILDVSEQRKDVGKTRRQKGVDPTLPQAALIKALSRAGGSFGTVKTNGVVAVSFSLTAAKMGEIPVPASPFAKAS
ncbi:MAG: hypothetical protein AB8B88_11895 [Devosiaceae bacterium]